MLISKLVISGVLRVFLTCNVDVVHISCWDLSGYLLNEGESELNIIRLAGLGVDVPIHISTLDCNGNDSQPTDQVFW